MLIPSQFYLAYGDLHCAKSFMKIHPFSRKLDTALHPSKYAVYRKFKKSGLSNNSLPACFEIGLFGIIFLRLSLMAIVSVVSHLSAVQKTKTENFIVLCVISHTKYIPITYCTNTIALYSRAITMLPAIKHHLSSPQI